MPLLTVDETAAFLHVSQSWVRRHLSSLPATRCGRLIRIDSDKLQTTMATWKSLEPERAVMPRRYQRGKIIWRNNVATGIYRVDVKTPTGVKRKQKWVRLGTRDELPTENAARVKLAALIGDGITPKKEAPGKMTFEELVAKWEAAEGPSLSVPTKANYTNALRAWVLPTFGDKDISTITRDQIQLFLNGKAQEYSKSTIKSMRLVLQIVLSYAHLSGWIPTYPCVRLKNPKVTNTKRCVKRVVQSMEQTLAIVGRLQEPYATLVLLLRRNGLRIEEGAALQLADLTNHVLRIQRVVYGGKVYDLAPDEQRDAPIMDLELLERMRALGAGHQWMFRSLADTPINPGNALKRYVRPAAKALGIHLGGWHDFRHSWITSLRQKNVHPKVISTLAGHRKVHLAMDVYDHPDLRDLEQALASLPVAGQLLANANNTTAVQ